MGGRIGFTLFKWTVYGLLALNSWLYLRTEPTITAFLDSAAWIVLLGVMEYESTTLDETRYGVWEKRILIALNVFAYGVILYAWWGYVAEERWLDVANATTWLLVCAVLLWQMYAPGDYEGWEYRAMNTAKAVLYGALAVIAAIWTIDATKPLDAVDAWLWIVCFAVIELNVFGFERGKPAAAPADG